MNDCMARFWQLELRVKGLATEAIGLGTTIHDPTGQRLCHCAHQRGRMAYDHLS